MCGKVARYQAFVQAQGAEMKGFFGGIATALLLISAFYFVDGYLEKASVVAEASIAAALIASLFEKT